MRGEGREKKISKEGVARRIREKEEKGRRDEERSEEGQKR